MENVAHRALAASGLTQKALARAVGVSLRTLAGWLGGAPISALAAVVLEDIARSTPSPAMELRLMEAAMMFPRQRKTKGT